MVATNNQLYYSGKNKRQLYYNDYKGPILLQYSQQAANFITILTTSGQFYYNTHNKRPILLQ